MKMIGYTEDRPLRSIHSGGGIVETREGDFVMIVVVRRWEDAPGALAQLAAMQQLSPKVDE